MSFRSETERERVTNVLKGLANKTRVALLLGLYNGKSRDEIAETVGMTRGGIHKNLERMREAELVYRPEEADYVLTPLGVYWAQLLNQEADTILAVLDELDAAEDPIRDKVEETKQSIEDQEEDGFSFQIDDTTWERTIHTEKWKQAKDRISEMLNFPEGEPNNGH